MLQDRHITSIKVNRKSYVVYLMLILPMICRMGEARHFKFAL